MGRRVDALAGDYIAAVKGGCTVEDVCRTLGLKPERAQRSLDALVNLKLVTKQGNRYYG